MRKVYLTFIVTFTVSLCCSAYDTAELYQVLSPEAATMTRYGNYPVSLYTGTVNISIPLYTIKNQDFEIPLSVNYDATGFIPNHQASAVGQNWTVQYGSMIVREVRGIPDEHSINNYGVFGLLDASYPLPPKNDLKDLTYAGTYLLGTAGLSSYGVEYRYEQDIFTVILPNGSSFKFLIGNNGLPQIIGKRACKIDLDGFEIITNETDANNITSTIKVTDEDGYIYTFGGNLSKLERSYNFKPSTGVILELGVTNAWYLSKIEAPHSSITYSYKSATVSVESDNNMYLKTVCGKGAPVNSYTLAFTKQVLPERITSDNILIDFHYSLQTNTFYGNYIHTITHTYVQPNYQLDSITVTDRASNAKRVIRFSYTLAQWNLQSYYGHRRFLTGLDIDGKHYSITYNSMSHLPYPMTNDIDKYGFYCPGRNDDKENTGMHPSEGMLKKITYPTGGSTEFTFENHKYKHKISRYTGGEIFEIGTNVSGNLYIGGVRIRRIANSDSTVTEFSYDGGVYYQSLRRFFYIEDDVLKEGYSDNFNYVSSCNYRGEPRIGYKTATEMRRNVGVGSSITKYYTFSTRYDVPDIPPAVRVINDNSVSYTASGYESLTDAGLIKVIVSPNDSRPVNEYLSILNMDINYSSRAAERGLLTSIKEYNGVHKVRQTDFEYGVTRNQRDDYTVSAENFKGISLLTQLAYSYLTYHYTCEPTKKTVKTYDNDNNYVTETFIYNRDGLLRPVNAHNMVTSILHTASDGDTIKTVFKRPLDYGTISSYNDSTTRGLYDLQQKNIVSAVIEETSFKGDSITSGSLTIFHHDNASSEPKPKYIYKLNQGTSLSDYSETVVSGGAFMFNSNIYDKYLTYDLYNGRGRLLQYTDRSGTPVSFIWGHSHQKILAKVVGGNYSAYSNNWGGGNGANIMFYNGVSLTPDDSHYNTINSLRNSYLVTTYKYDLLSGVTSITSPTGVTTYYDYYPSGELKSEFLYGENGHKQILKAYNYKYQEPAQ